MQKSSKTSQISSDTEAWCWFLVVVRQWWAPGVAQARHRPNAACWKWGSGCGALPLPVLFSPFLWIWQGWGGREETELNRREGGSTQCDHAINNLKGEKKAYDPCLSLSALMKANCCCMVLVGLEDYLFSVFFSDSSLYQKWNGNYLPELVCHIESAVSFWLSLPLISLLPVTLLFFFFFPPLTIYLW